MSEADQRITYTPVAQLQSKERTAAAPSLEAAPATSFISGYTDLRNEGRAPNALFFCFLLYPLTTLPSLSSLLSLCLLNSQRAEMKNKRHSKLNVESIQTGCRKAQVISKQHLQAISLHCTTQHYDLQSIQQLVKTSQWCVPEIPASN